MARERSELLGQRQTAPSEPAFADLEIGDTASLETCATAEFSAFYFRRSTASDVGITSRGIGALWRTGSMVLPWTMSPTNLWPCVVMAIKSQCSALAIFTI